MSAKAVADPIGVYKTPCFVGDGAAPAAPKRAEQVGLQRRNPMSDDAAEAALRHALVTNLMSASAQKIDFWRNGIHVDGGGLHGVANLLLMYY